MLLIICAGLGAPLIVTYLETGLVPRFPTAILAAAIAQLGFLFRHWLCWKPSRRAAAKRNACVISILTQLRTNPDDHGSPVFSSRRFARN
jgi:hypothetical protein